MHAIDVKAVKFVEEPVNLNLTAELKKHVGGEVFLFSCNIVKYNSFGWRNGRTFLLTQESLMLLKNKCRDLRRKVAINSIIGITMSYHHESSEMIIHVGKEEDIRILSPGHRKQIMDSLKMFYATKTKGLNLPIYAVR